MFMFYYFLRLLFVLLVFSTCLTCLTCNLTYLLLAILIYISVITYFTIKLITSNFKMPKLTRKFLIAAQKKEICEKKNSQPFLKQKELAI